ncbi:MAG: NAD-dependent epimerase/dehydratase family protein [Oscillospiraceae bacterium]|jgi:dTDP-glucose 4,6-dehydratase/UDP-glucuronate decarboxylase|nr:NAD-dependent epimerase/dehydratase family protein [Oscillospiraceae bacterium]
MDKIIAEDCLRYLPEIDLSPMKGKTVLVTGANGMIGTYLIYFLHLANVRQNAGIRIAAVSKHPPCRKLCGLFPEDEENYRFLAADLAGPKEAEIPWKTDYIIHAATYAQPEIFMKNFSETIRLNIFITESLLKKAKTDGAKFLFLSSSEVYGNPDPAHIPTPEDYPGLCSPLSLRSVYAESKRAGETLCCAYRKLEGVDAKIARIFMSYGPGLTIRDKRVTGQFLKQALLERKITMLDDGKKVRTFCYIADCAGMLLNVLISGKDTVYNVGGTDRITIRQLAEEICRQTGSSLTAGHPRLPAEKETAVSPETVEPDLTKIRSEFRLPPFLPLREGLARTIEWNRALLEK